MFVLGIDPGLTRCGYGVVEQSRGQGRGQGGRKPRAVAAGVIRTSPHDEVPARLAELLSEVQSLIVDYQPAVVAVERVLFQVNVSTAMSVGQASGVAMAAAAAAGCDVIEYSPNEIKSAITGDGSADKDQMEQMVQLLLGIPQPLRPVDAADAVAVALCHLAHSPQLVSRNESAANARGGAR